MNKSISRFIASSLTAVILLSGVAMPISRVAAKEGVGDSGMVAPVGLITTTVTENSIALAWTRSLSMAGDAGSYFDFNSSFVVYRTQGDNTDFTNASIVGTAPGTKGTSNLIGQFTDTTVMPGTKYNYKVAARGEGTTVPESTNSNMVTVTTPGINPTVTFTLSGSLTNNNTNSRLDWTAYPSASGYKIERKSSSESAFSLLTETGDVQNFVDTAVQPGMSYTYRVAPKVQSGEVFVYGSFSNEVVVSIPVSQNPSAQKIVLTGSLIDSSTRSQLNWSVYPTAIGYRVERKAGSESNFSPISDPVSGQMFTDTVQPGMTYTYRVTPRIYDPSTNYYYGTPSNEVTLTTPAVQNNPSVTTISNNIPSQPPITMILTGKAKSATETEMSWTPTDGASEYDVMRSKNGGAFEKAGIALGNTAVDSNLTPGTKYDYYIEAKTPQGSTSVKSNTVTVMTPAAATPVTTPVSTPVTTPTMGGYDYGYPYPADGMPLTAGEVCGRNDTMSPARILNPNSDIKFTLLPKTAVFRAGSSFPFTYCYKGTGSYSVKIVRSLYDAGGMLVGAQTVGRRTLRSGQIFSLTPTQALGRGVAPGMYQVRVQIVDESPSSVGDESIPLDKLLADNAFMIAVTGDSSIVPTGFPSGVSNPGNLLVGQNDASMVKFPYFSKRNIYRSGETLRFPITFKNATGATKRLSVQYRLTNSSGAVISTQNRSATLGSNKMFSWNVAQPLFTNLPSGIYTFTAVITDLDTNQQLDSNSFSFAVTM